MPTVVRCRLSWFVVCYPSGSEFKPGANGYLAGSESDVSKDTDPNLRQLSTGFNDNVTTICVNLCQSADKENTSVRAKLEPLSFDSLREISTICDDLTWPMKRFRSILRNWRRPSISSCCLEGSILIIEFGSRLPNWTGANTRGYCVYLHNNHMLWSYQSLSPFINTRFDAPCLFETCCRLAFSRDNARSFFP